MNTIATSPVFKLVVVHALHDSTSGDIDDKAWAAAVVRNDPVRHPVPHHVVGHIAFAGIHETRCDIS